MELVRPARLTSIAGSPIFKLALEPKLGYSVTFLGVES